VTLSLKNLVGINGNKNFLPHHRAGSTQDGGDEYPARTGNTYGRFRAWALDAIRPILGTPLFTPFLRFVRHLDVRTRPTSMIRNGNWSGNDTVWRMILDLNRALIYADPGGRIHASRQRQTYHVIDGIVGGDGDGPMAPRRRDTDLIICSDDPVGADVVACALMGFEPTRIPVIAEACKPHPLPITSLTESLDGLEIHFLGRVHQSWQELPNLGFLPHSGWKGQIERNGLVVRSPSGAGASPGTLDSDA
jgi:hypothetical protein